MKLAHWLDQSGIPRSTFAKQIGLTAGAVTQLCDDAFQPRLPVLVAIERATGGAVTAQDFLKPDQVAAE